MGLPKGRELEWCYGPFFENRSIQEAFDQRMPSDAEPVEEDAILAFVQATDKAHAEYVRSVFERLGDLSPAG